jgi:hypothetical protein
MLISVIGFSQNIKKDNLEIYLKDYEESEVNISKGMYMTQNKQYFYEGTLEVVDNDTKTTKKYLFYFSKWDKKFKEFVVKDLEYNYLSPEFEFSEDNQMIKFLNHKGENTSVKLKDNSGFEMAILSSMLVWLENFPST